MLFNELAIVLSLASVLGIIAIWAKQPSILGYIVAGFLLALAGHLNAGSVELMDSLASIGVALLLFLVGLEMNFDKIKQLGWHIIIIGILQSVVSIALGFGILQLLHFGIITSIYLSFAFSFSSTIIAIKLLSEKKDLSSLYGRIVVGIMLLEDFIAILMIIFLEGLGQGGAINNIAADFAITMGKGALLLVGTLIISRIMPKVLDFIGTKGETIFLFSIAWGIGVAALVATKQVGLGVEAGGFLAGLALARSAEHYEVSNKIRWLRDFFIVLFFVILGSRMAVGGGVAEVIVPALIMSAFVVIINPIITIIVMNSLGYTGKTAFLVGITTAQISEFSLVIAARGGELGHLSPSQVNLVTLVGIITIVFSSYLIMNSDAAYKIFRKPLSLLESKKKVNKKKGEGEEFLTGHMVVIGAHRLGQGMIKGLEKSSKKFSVIDFDPHIVKDLERRGIPVYQGDGADEEVQESAGVSRAKLVISTASSVEDSASIIKTVRRSNKKAKIIVTADSEWEGVELYKMGADYVVMPHFIGGEHIGEALMRDDWTKAISGMRKRDIDTLKKERGAIF